MENLVVNDGEEQHQNSGLEKNHTERIVLLHEKPDEFQKSIYVALSWRSR